MSIQRKLSPKQLDPKRLRGQLAVILMITVGIGIAFGRLLLHLGLTSLMIRNAIMFPVTYFTFFVCVYFWRKHAEKIKSISDKVEFADESNQGPQRNENNQKKGSWLDYVGFDLAEGTIILVLIVIIIYVIVWLFGEAPAIVAEAFFDIGLTGSLAGAIRKRHNALWYVGLFRKTIVAFLAFYVASLLLMFFAHTTCPGQPTLTKIVSECWMPMRATSK